jgi:hypothetical protein
MRALVGAILLVSSISIIGLAASASAEQECHTETETKTLPDGTIQTTVKEVCTIVTEGGNDGENGDGCFSSPGHEIPCSLDSGYVWFGSHFCYASAASSLYPVGDPHWQGHIDGSLWMCNGVGPTMAPASADIFWVPAGETPALIDPTVLAQRALDRMQLATPSIHMAPESPAMTYVGLDTWLWMDRSQFGRLQMTVRAGGTSVTVSAEPVRAWWDMGDGDGTSCPSAGRPWVAGMTSVERTDCSYAYQRVSDFEPNRVFPVAVNLVYQVDWTCSGACLTASGSLGEVDGPTANGSIRVGERQSVVIGGNQ